MAKLVTPSGSLPSLTMDMRLSMQLPRPVTVTTVVTGLMRAGFQLQARFTGQAGKGFTWFSSSPACRCCRWAPCGLPVGSSRRSAPAGRK